MGILTATVYTANLTDKRVWVTIYDLAKTAHLDYGWMEPYSYRAWTSGNYAFGSFYHVRGEVKSNSAGGDPNIYDTSVEINPQAIGSDCAMDVPDGAQGIIQIEIGGTDMMWYLAKGTGNYYWSRDIQPFAY